VRRALDTLYLWSGYAAAVFLVAIAATVVAQIVGRFFGVAVDSTESAGFSMAAATFLGLAHTFKQGAHIRVNLLIGLSKGRVRQGFELWTIGFMLAAMAYFTYWAGDLVYYSYVFHEISPGLLAIPFWIPRSAMAVGSFILTVALLDELVRVLSGATPSYEANAETVLGNTPLDAGTPAGGQ
jgi:TRAP-type C4-dicarboxylate transport system permease small subunit